MRNTKLRWAGILCLIAVALMAGCGGMETTRAEAPGMYNLTGWGNWSGDVNGEVGHKFFLNSPTAKCLPSRNWTMSSRVISGALPPGLAIDDGTFHITGIPTERGHWIVKLQVSDVQCGGQYYQGFDQELRFHITGSGRVVQ